MFQKCSNLGRLVKKFTPYKTQPSVLRTVHTFNREGWEGPSLNGKSKLDLYSPSYGSKMQKFGKFSLEFHAQQDWTISFEIGARICQGRVGNGGGHIMYYTSYWDPNGWPQYSKTTRYTRCSKFNFQSGCLLSRKSKWINVTTSEKKKNGHPSFLKQGPHWSKTK